MAATRKSPALIYFYTLTKHAKGWLSIIHHEMLAALNDIYISKRFSTANKFNNLILGVNTSFI